MSGARPRIAAVVLARDRAETTSHTLEALLSQDPPPDALVLVGNDASEAVVDVLREAAARHPAAELVLLERNAGAAGGFHAGIEAAMARGVEYVCCFDDDARPLPGCLAALVATAQRHADTGCVGALTHDGSERLAWPLWIDGEPRPARTVDAVRDLAARRDPLTAVAFSWHGLLVPAAVVRRHGNVDAALFHQYEDAEFGLRLRRAGLRNYVATEAESVHPPAPPARELRILRWSIRLTRETPAKEYLSIRNDLVVRRRYDGARFWYGSGPLIVVRGVLVCLSLDMPRRAALREVFARALLDAARRRLGPPPARLNGLAS